jgi:hypothetical protein
MGEGIREDLKNLIAQARAEDKLIYSQYQQLWFTPGELEKANAENRFLWGLVNWELRSRDERESIATRNFNEAKKEYENAVASCRKRD